MRYVILEHRQVDSIHWDLMLEQPYPWALLRTWSLERCPPDRGWRNARELAPHRPVYLVYEGPIHGSRGWVRRWDEGTYRLQAEEPGLVRALLRGRRLNGLVELCQLPGGTGDWQYRYQLALGT